MIAASFCRSLLGALLTLASAQATIAAEPSSAADDADPQLARMREICRASSVPCREQLRIVLRRDKGETYDETHALLPPPVQPGMVSVYPGETVRAVPTFEGDRFSGWRAVRDDEPADTQILSIELKQTDDRAGMSAVVATNTGPALKLRMGLIRLDAEDPESTSSCPLQAGGGTNHEMWPYPIFVLLVADATRPTPEQAGVCR